MPWKSSYTDSWLVFFWYSPNRTIYKYFTPLHLLYRNVFADPTLLLRCFDLLTHHQLSSLPRRWDLFGWLRRSSLPNLSKGLLSLKIWEGVRLEDWKDDMNDAKIENKQKQIKQDTPKWYNYRLWGRFHVCVFCYLMFISLIFLWNVLQVWQIVDEVSWNHRCHKMD